MAVIKQVLIAYDDSDCAKQALEFACEFVKRFDAIRVFLDGRNIAP